MLCSRTLLRTTESWKRCVDEEQGCRSARSLLLGSTRLQLARPDREHAVQRSEGRKEGRKEENTDGCFVPPDPPVLRFEFSG